MIKKEAASLCGLLQPVLAQLRSTSQQSNNDYDAARFRPAVEKAFQHVCPHEDFTLPFGGGNWPFSPQNWPDYFLFSTTSLPYVVVVEEITSLFSRGRALLAGTVTGAFPVQMDKQRIRSTKKYTNVFFFCFPHTYAHMARSWML